MSPRTQEKLEKVKKYSAALGMLFFLTSLVLVFAGLIGVIIILTVNDGQEVSSIIRFAGGTFTGEEITWTVKIVVTIGWVLALSIALKLLSHLGALFGHYSKGEIFTSGTVRQIRDIGISVFLFVALGFYGHLSNAILGVPREARDAARAGMEVRGWGFGIPEPLVFVLGGIIIIVISWIMDVGRELREDQDLTV